MPPAKTKSGWFYRELSPYGDDDDDDDDALSLYLKSQLFYPP